MLVHVIFDLNRELRLDRFCCQLSETAIRVLTDIADIVLRSLKVGKVIVCGEKRKTREIPTAITSRLVLVQVSLQRMYSCYIVHTYRVHPGGS